MLQLHIQEETGSGLQTRSTAQESSEAGSQTTMDLKGLEVVTTLRT